MHNDFPAWLRIEHWLNVLFVTLLIRSGIEILATHPRLYWRNHSRPGTEWARFTRKTMPKDKLYDTMDEEEDYSPIVSLPGHKKIGIGRHWHFFTVMGWLLLGISYWTLLFATGQWRRYLPTSWDIFPAAWHDLVSYDAFRLPPMMPGQPFDALQKLSYAGVIFLLAPFQILTGLAQAPAIEARFPWYVRMFGGRQAARSLHYLGLLAFLGFTAVHLMMVGFWGWPRLNALMIFGEARNLTLAFWLSLAIIAAIVAVHVAATVWSLRSPRSVQRRIGAVNTAVKKLL
ncbi:cytochrome b/b6 domain-containing protein, partial [Sphaerimonospora thailandensis]|uniref:cytochrome b/b6 domain-containing protein n=1 Tax=Sphaerimonospora thailandensis TaxID=795644 RepID=UPI0019503B52